ncbi:MGMT family protein [Candidatus Woesearchaeota archaeon]|nr:MGMT family protein [Candidatus Woesearchaeota archaeon]
MKFSERVYQLCRRIPKGKISTYKNIGDKLGIKSYRAVGQALRKNPSPVSTPCHRVVKSDGKIGGFKGKTSGRGIKEKIKLLGKEGVKVRNSKVVDFEKVLYKFKDIKD